MRAYNKLAYGKKKKIFNAKKAYKPSRKKKKSVSSRAAKKASKRSVSRTNRNKKLRTSRNKYFRVRKGHTVYEVMRRTGVPVDKIIRLNRLKKPYHIKVGQRLRLR